MDSNILLEALKLLAVGMSTVFVVLIIIIQGGKLLIMAVNKLVPEDEPKPVIEQKSVSPLVSKAISAAVTKVTGGSAEVLDIKPL